MALLTSTKGTLDLNCYPKVNSSIQQAWDAADIYLIESATYGTNPAVVNDQWGALSCFIASETNQTDTHLYCWSDSFCSQTGIKNNLTANKKATSAQTNNAISFDQEAPNFPNNTDSIWVQCPKSFDQLHWWLSLAQRQLGSGITVYLAGMAKHIPVKWLKWLEANTNDYQQYPIKKKARLMKFNLGETLPPLTELKSYNGIDTLAVSGLPGVFSRDHMDIGSRLLIHELSKLPALEGSVVDLGCGNGLLCLAALHYSSADKIDLVLCDDSSVALQSAKTNLEARNYHKAQYRHTDALHDVKLQADTILCNPPFHSGNRISTAAAERMFKQSASCLTPSGQLIVIANRHLPYAPVLKKHFNSVKIITSDSKFVIYQCRNSKRK